MEARVADERYVVCGMGGWGAFDEYDKAREFAEREAEMLARDPIGEEPRVPIFTVTDTEHVTPAPQDPEAGN